LLRGRNVEYGRNPDTGGQTRYLLELARAADAHGGFTRTDIITRLIDGDPEYDRDYARPVERLGARTAIRRVESARRGYIPKEELWDELPAMETAIMRLIDAQGRAPDYLHAHYADAGLLGARLARRLGAPLVFTAHSLGK